MGKICDLTAQYGTTKNLFLPNFFMFRLEIMAFIAFIFLFGCTQSQFQTSTKITFENSPFQLNAEIANTSKTRAQGLMLREYLPQNNAMLFIYPEQRILSFWMANTKIPLDIVFLDKNKTIVDIQKMPPCFQENTALCPHYLSKNPAIYALELNQNLSDKYALKIGQKAFWD